MSLNHQNATIPVLSIIIPAHNSEPTLKRTLDSILQGCSVSLLKQIEVLIVENGSTDHTLEVAKNLEKTHSFVKVLISEPKVANARNYGIEHAVGKWLFFLDADDRLVKGALKILLSDTTCTNTDMIAYCYYSGETRRQLTKVRIIDSSLSKKAEMIENPTLYMQVWSKLFRKDVIERYHIRFDNRLMLSEDSDFTLQFLKECGSLILSDKYIYLYSLNANSIMHTNPQTKLLEYQSAMQITQKKIQTTAPIFQSAFMFYVAMHVNIAMVRGPFVQGANKANERSFEAIDIPRKFE